MSKVRELRPNPNNPASIVDQTEELARVLNSEVEFGEPTNPFDSSSSVRAGDAAANHNGIVQNIRGAWVEKVVTANNTAFLCHHNLYLDSPGYVLPAAGSPNVRWLLAYLEHSGAAPPLATPGPITVEFRTGDAVAENSIELRVTSTGRTISAGSPVRLTLFFTRATRGVP